MIIIWKPLDHFFSSTLSKSEKIYIHIGTIFCFYFNNFHAKMQIPPHEHSSCHIYQKTTGCGCSSTSRHRIHQNQAQDVKHQQNLQNRTSTRVRQSVLEQNRRIQHWFRKSTSDTQVVFDQGAKRCSHPFLWARDCGQREVRPLLGASPPLDVWAAAAQLSRQGRKER